VRDLQAIDVRLRLLDGDKAELARLLRRRTVVLELIQAWTDRYAPGSSE
jgi:hypothetical protein